MKVAAHEVLRFELVAGNAQRRERDAEQTGDFAHACGFGQADFLDDVYLGDGNGAAEAGRHRAFFYFADAPVGVHQKVIDPLRICHFSSPPFDFSAD